MSMTDKQHGGCHKSSFGYEPWKLPRPAGREQVSGDALGPSLHVVASVVLVQKAVSIVRSAAKEPTLHRKSSPRVMADTGPRLHLCVYASLDSAPTPGIRVQGMQEFCPGFTSDGLCSLLLSDSAAAVRLYSPRQHPAPLILANARGK